MIRIRDVDAETKSLYYFMWFQGGAVVRSCEADDNLPRGAKQEVLKALMKAQAEGGAFGYER